MVRYLVGSFLTICTADLLYEYAIIYLVLTNYSLVSPIPDPALPITPAIMGLDSPILIHSW